MFDVFTINEGVIVRIDEFKTRDDALAFARSSPPSSPASHGQNANEAPISRGPRVERVVPILNVSDIHASFEWFEKLGWDKGFEWKRTPPTTPRASVLSRPAAARSSSAATAKAAAAKAPTARPSAPTATRPPTKACGCLSGSTTSTPSINAASAKASTSPTPRPRAMGRARIPRPPPRRPRVPNQHQPLTHTRTSHPGQVRRSNDRGQISSDPNTSQKPPIPRPSTAQLDQMTTSRPHRRRV